MDGLRLDHVVVIEDEDKRIWKGCNLVDQGCQNRFNRRRLRGLECAQHTLPDVRVNPFDLAQGKRLQGGDKVSHAARQVIVALVQRDSGDGSSATTDPFAQQRGLAKAGRGGDEGELTVKPCIQLLNQARAWD